MNGAHDLGGMHGFGPIVAERNEPVFHAEWEKLVFGMTLACGFLGLWNIDRSRQAREQVHPGVYLSASYYEHWLHGLEQLLAEEGIVDRSEIDARIHGDNRIATPHASLRAIPITAVADILAAGNPTALATDQPPRFRVGDHIRTRNINPPGHTRLPRYARARIGIIKYSHGAHVFPDANASGSQCAPQHLYAVQFSARELWGNTAAATDSVYLDLWDDYLEST